MMAIRNIILDIGNVIVTWNPARIVGMALGADRATLELIAAIFGQDIWHPLNRGTLTTAQAKAAWCAKIGISAAEADRLFDAVLESLDLMPETVALMDRLDAAGYDLFALSDNVDDIVAHLKERHDFWRYFKGAAISSELGVMKPGPEIFRWLLREYGLAAHECVFFDDMPGNVDGARAIGLHAFLFTTAAQAEADLRGLGISLPDPACTKGDERVSGD